MSTKDTGPGPADLITVRKHRHLETSLERAVENDLIVIDHRDLDAATARALADARPFAVLNTAEFVSGRYANLGPRVLMDAGVVLLEADRDAANVLRDGGKVRYDDDHLYDGEIPLLPVHRISAAELDERLDASRAGLADQLGSFAHTTGVVLRQEEDLLLHGLHLPDLQARLAGRPVVVLTPAARRTDLTPLRRFLRQQRPVVVAVDGGAELAGRRGIDVLVTTPTTSLPDAVLRRARELVLIGSEEPVKAIQRLEVPIHRVDTTLPHSDVALLLAHEAAARVIIPVGTPASLEEFVDRERGDQAGLFLTRIRLGARWVEPSSVPLLYTGRVRAWQVIAVLLVALAVLAVTFAATPIGQDWWQELSERWGW